MVASGSQNMTSYFAKQVIGSANAANASGALLQTGAGRDNNTWIFWDTERQSYGIRYLYNSSGEPSLELYGGKDSNDNLIKSAWINLGTGDTTLNGILTAGSVTTDSVTTDVVTATRLIATATNQVSGTSANTVALITGNATGTHLEYDGNEIQAKASGTTVGTLYLNYRGGGIILGLDNDSSNVAIRYTTAASSSTTGALQVDGGVGIVKQLHVGSHTYINGQAILRNQYVDLTDDHNGSTDPDTDFNRVIYWYDKSGKYFARIYGRADYSGATHLFLQASNYDTAQHYGGIAINCAKDGTITYSVSNAANFRSAIGAGTSSLELGTTSSTAMAGNTVVTHVSIGANVTTNANYPVVFATSTTDTIAAVTEALKKSGAKFYFNPSTGQLTATKFSGNLTGNVTGDLTGNADTATELATARSINGTNFDGSANITTTKWGTARNITIEDADSTNAGTAVSVNGSAAVTLLLPDTIKASLTGHASLDVALTGSTMTGTLSFNRTSVGRYLRFYQDNTECGSIRLQTLGPAGTEGKCTIYLGNSTASSAENNASGRILMYNSQGSGSNGYVELNSKYGTFAGTANLGYLALGNVSTTKVTNAVWNDYAEFRHADSIEPGRVFTETTSGIMTIANERLMPACKVSSDTFGNCMGETETAKTPIAVAGRVLVYPYKDRNQYELGAAVCSAPNGTVDIMTREEIMTYPERIIGTVSEIPTYDIWHGGLQDGENDIKVNGRIWIYIR